MLSRVAESIYWLCRYMERAENYARFLDVNFYMLPEMPMGITEQWRPLVMTTGDYPTFEKRYGEANVENVVTFLVFDRENSNSILSCLHNARECARSVREIISSEMWRQLNDLYLSVSNVLKHDLMDRDNPAEFFREIKMGSHLFNGIMDATYSNSEGWHFGNIGRSLERADKTTRILDMKYYYLLPSVNHVGSALDLLQWSALLKSASAFEMYRKKFGSMDISRIVQFLVLDREFPRSVRYSVIRAEESLRQITGIGGYDYRNRAERSLGKIRADLDFIDVPEIFQTGLHEFLDGMQIRLNDAASMISDTFFELHYSMPKKV